jgi:hypothetical protein
MHCVHYVWLSLSVCATQVIAPAELGAERDSQQTDWKTKTVHLHVKQQSMAELLRALVEAAGCSILADGEPVQQTVDLQFDGTAAEALSKIADTFDYDWKQSRAGIVWMVKRFRDPRERPQMNPLELRKTAEDVLRVMRAVPIDDRPLAEHFGLLYETFTPEQRKAVQNGLSLRIDQLTPSQYKLVLRAIDSNLLYAPAEAWGRLLAHLTNITAAHLQLEEIEVWLDFEGKKKDRQLAVRFHPAAKPPGVWPVSLVYLPWQPIPKTRQERQP